MPPQHMRILQCKHPYTVYAVHVRRAENVLNFQNGEQMNHHLNKKQLNRIYRMI